MTKSITCRIVVVVQVDVAVAVELEVQVAVEVFGKLVARAAVVLVSMLKFVINLIFSFRLRIFIVPFGRRMIKSQLTHAFFVAVLLHIFAYHFDCLDRCLRR